MPLPPPPHRSQPNTATPKTHHKEGSVGGARWLPVSSRQLDSAECCDPSDWPCPIAAASQTLPNRSASISSAVPPSRATSATQLNLSPFRSIPCETLCTLNWLELASLVVWRALTFCVRLPSHTLSSADPVLRRLLSTMQTSQLAHTAKTRTDTRAAHLRSPRLFLSAFSPPSIICPPSPPSPPPPSPSPPPPTDTRNTARNPTR